jgi:ABC-type sugar transport system permease subunit
VDSASLGAPLRAAEQAGRRRLWRRGKVQLRGYLWIAPAFVVMGAILFYPIARVLGYSLTNQTTLFPGSKFVGVDNYTTLAHTHLFWRACLNNLILLASVPIVIVLGLVLTAVLFRGLRGGSTYEAVLFLPFLPAIAAVGVLFIYILGFHGPLNNMLRTFGMPQLAHAWLSDSRYAIWSILAVVIWKRLGFTVLLFMARMLSIDRSLFEAAAVDGASWGQTFRQIALPELRRIVQFAAVLGFIEVFAWTFAYVFVLTRGGPDQNTYTLEFLLYRYQFANQLVGLASAVAVVLLLIALTVAVYRVRAIRQEPA